MTSLEIDLAAIKTGGWLADGNIDMLAAMLNDYEKVRTANGNLVSALTRERGKKDKDGVGRGFGLTDDNPYVVGLKASISIMKSGEEQLVKDLEKAMKRHPLVTLVNGTRGLGLKQMGRLLKAVGDPYWNHLHERPRTVSELWAYCGYDVRNGAASKRQTGKQSNWNPEARMRARLISEALTISGRKMDDKRGPQDMHLDRFRMIYDVAREKYVDAVHPTACVRCGPKGKPAQPGTPLADGHKHARALRVVSKELLKELWIASRDLYQDDSIATASN